MKTTNPCIDPECPSFGTTTFPSRNHSCRCRVNIRLVRINPPVPTELFDWVAINDDTYDGSVNDPIGYGPTKNAAIADLMSQIEECRS